MTHPERALKVFFYVQHLLGIGHLARASHIAGGLIEDGFDVTLVTGGMPVAGFPKSGIDHIALPAIAAGDGGFTGLVDAEGAPVDDVFKEVRRQQLLAAYHDKKPDIVVIEAFPFGRRQVRFELLPLLNAIKATAPRPLLVTSIRDILQRRSKPERDAETAELVNQHFDYVLVHGDPEFVRLEDTFAPAKGIAERVVYTGMVCGPPPPPPDESYEVVVSAGGGAVGAALIQSALEAATLLPKTGPWCVITGPNLPQDDFDRLAQAAPGNVRLFRFRTDFPSLLSDARLSISQAGYNTVGDTLMAGCQALLIPFAAGGETEQTDRAKRLERRGRAVVLPESDLTGPTMADAVKRLLVAPSTPTIAIQTDGAQRTAKALRRLHSKFAEHQNGTSP
ncbi:glycosyltransferase family protein [Aliiroseovarius sp. YM-037]|uniref:glycosyltransferase family protein n=1 Tax=Aliiroseovarius sp. YM-037 TaxID=3341728 RepID=UPI003A806C4D